MTANGRKGRGSSAKDKANRLVGWLISYEMDELGHAYEIRAGRTLISSHQQNGNRAITVQEDTVSSPHSALHASRRHQVLVQDVFSDYGTYLQRATAKKEEAVSGPIELEHGDWLRIGENTRLQLCLIEGAGK